MKAIKKLRSSLFETSQTLFWAVFGLIDLENFELNEIKIFTRFWGMLMYGTYSVINIVVLLNLLIAMMNHSYQLISVSKETERNQSMTQNSISVFDYLTTSQQRPVGPVSEECSVLVV